MSSHDLVTGLVQLILSGSLFGGLYKLLTLRAQHRGMASSARRTDAETRLDEANATAVIVGPWERSVAEAERRAARAEETAQGVKDENEVLRGRLVTAEHRATNAERRLARIEQYIEGPMRAWQRRAIADMQAAGLVVTPAPALASWRGVDAAGE